MPLIEWFAYRGLQTSLGDSGTRRKNRNSALLINQSVRVADNPTRERGIHFGPLLEVIKIDVDPSHFSDSK